MFCPKCHTYIEDDSIKFCKRCGTEINKNKKHNYFSSSSTFKYMSKYGANSHQNQYEYSKNYSDVTKEADDTHKEQFDYSNKYSEVKKETPNDHADQHEYSKNYSQIKINTQNNHADQHEYSKNYSQVKVNTQNDRDDQYNYSKLYNLREKYVTSDDDYLKAYIGSSYIEISKMKYSIPSLIFGPLYLIYRKMFAMGIILEILILGIQFLTSDSVSTTINILINLGLFYKFKNLYINYAHKKVDEIKTINSDKSSTEIINLCKFKGGTISFKKITIYAFIIYFLSTIISALSTDIPITEENDLTTYKIQDYEYKIDKELSNSENKTITDEYQNFAYISEDDYCTYKIQLIESNYSTKDYLIKKQYIYSADYFPSNIITENRKNNTWKKQEYQSKQGSRKLTIYALQDNNKLYTMEYQTENNTSKCVQMKETIIKTFKKWTSLD